MNVRHQVVPAPKQTIPEPQGPSPTKNPPILTSPDKSMTYLYSDNESLLLFSPGRSTPKLTATTNALPLINRDAQVKTPISGNLNGSPTKPISGTNPASLQDSKVNPIALHQLPIDDLKAPTSKDNLT